MKWIVVWVALLGVVTAAGHSAAAEERAGPHLVTVIGDVANPNRPAFDAFRDAFFKARDETFAAAHGFDRAALAAMPQVTVEANAEGWPAAITARGPRLADVMEAAGVAAGATLTFMALDGYTVALDAAERGARDWVLAIEMNGAPLAIGGRGPAWLVHDTAGETVAADQEGGWVWAVFLISAQN
jgi:hypothetical protein